MHGRYRMNGYIEIPLHGSCNTFIQFYLLPFGSSGRGLQITSHHYSQLVFSKLSVTMFPQSQGAICREEFETHWVYVVFVQAMLLKCCSTTGMINESKHSNLRFQGCRASRIGIVYVSQIFLVFISFLRGAGPPTYCNKAGNLNKSTEWNRNSVFFSYSISMHFICKRQTI